MPRCRRRRRTPGRGRRCRGDRLEHAPGGRRRRCRWRTTAPGRVGKSSGQYVDATRHVDGPARVPSRRVEVAERIRATARSLTAAERRVAEAILASPQSVGFGTVADLADRPPGRERRRWCGSPASSGSTATATCRRRIQHDLLRQLRPAVERIDESSATDRGPHLAVELGQRAGDARRRRHDGDRAPGGAAGRPRAPGRGALRRGVGRVSPCSSPTSSHQLRDDVRVLAGSEVAVRRDIAVLPPVDDGGRDRPPALRAAGCSTPTRRLRERGDLVGRIHRQHALAARGRGRTSMFVLSADSVGPFDSHVGTLALLEPGRRRGRRSLASSARDRLDGRGRRGARRGSLTES